MPPIRVLLADDHRLLRRGLRQICQTLGGFEIVGEAEDGEEAVRLARELQPDVILMDIAMPGLNGVQATQAIVEENPSAAVIILTMYKQEQYVFEAIRAGAQGYLTKDIDELVFVDAIRAVHRGDALITPGLTSRLIEEFRRLNRCCPQQENGSRLTAGEMDVLRLVAHGDDNKRIAERLNLSDNTVSNRLRDIYGKLQVKNRTQAALEALRRGWVELDEGE